MNVVDTLRRRGPLHRHLGICLHFLFRFDNLLSLLLCSGNFCRVLSDKKLDQTEHRPTNLFAYVRYTKVRSSDDKKIDAFFLRIQKIGAMKYLSSYPQQTRPSIKFL